MSKDKDGKEYYGVKIIMEGNEGPDGGNKEMRVKENTLNPNHKL